MESFRDSFTDMIGIGCIPARGFRSYIVWVREYGFSPLYPLEADKRKHFDMWALDRYYFLNVLKKLMWQATFCMSSCSSWLRTHFFFVREIPDTRFSDILRWDKEVWNDSESKYKRMRCLRFSPWIDKMKSSQAYDWVTMGTASLCLLNRMRCCFSCHVSLHRL